jgi:hypothetical protein
MIERRRLTRILALKQLLENARKGELSAARDELQRSERALELAARSVEERAQALAVAQELSPVELADRARAVLHARTEERCAEERVRGQREQVLLHEELALVATREVKSVERLKIRSDAHTRTQTRLAEQRMLEDLVSAGRRGAR